MSLYLVDYRVRSYIAFCLKTTVSNENGDSEAAAFHLALCFRLGFGVEQNSREAMLLMKQSKRMPIDLDLAVELIKGNSNIVIQNSLFSQLVTNGYIKTRDFGDYYREENQLDLAELEYRREIADSRLALGHSHRIVLFLQSILAIIVKFRGRWEEAEKLQLDVLETSKTVFGLEHPETLTDMANLASMYHDQGRFEEAEKMTEQVLTSRKNVLEAEHSDIQMSTIDLASIYRNQTRWKQAEELEVQVLEKI